ncbi:MAG: helix-turn-helix domain-containing protein [Chitinophagales bacterium]
MPTNSVQIEIKLSEQDLHRISESVTKMLEPLFLKLQKENDDELLDIKTVCKLKRKSRQTIYTYIKNEVRPFDKPVRIGRSIFFKKSDLINF